MSQAIDLDEKHPPIATIDRQALANFVSQYRFMPNEAVNNVGFRPAVPMTQTGPQPEKAGGPAPYYIVRRDKKSLTAEESRSFFELADSISKDANGHPRSFNELASLFGISVQTAQEIYARRAASQHQEHTARHLDNFVTSSTSMSESVSGIPPTLTEPLLNALNSSGDLSLQASCLMRNLPPLQQKRIEKKLLEFCLAYRG